MMDANNGAGDTNDGSIDKTKLIINYIPPYATEGELSQIFSTIGKPEDVKIMKDFKTGFSLGFGFVKYATEEEAAKAIKTLNGYTMMDKRLKVAYSRPPGKGTKDSNLYITNIPKNITTEQELDNIFSKFGQIVQRTLVKDKITGKARGIAFVRFLKRSRKSIIIECDDIITWRRNYLTCIKQCKSKGKPIYYFDETWVNEGHIKDKVWVDTDIKNRRQAFIEGLSTGLKNPSGKGKRLVVIYTYLELGFVNGGLLLFKGRNVEDCHEEMNASVFENWFGNTHPSTITKKRSHCNG
ncbi:sex-lethal homolog isoform X2 [Diabrotica virgifera virgifera]|uniref:RRM domain-containing protein n=1 Tax=Diabrotica virgifera virgifera TaxID=50390 RepID=A0ABM5JL41_DIAVI|nr:sex-lethal homolog isoform X2 [Diabrotica virgifera virgifera]